MKNNLFLSAFTHLPSYSAQQICTVMLFCSSFQHYIRERKSEVRVSAIAILVFPLFRAEDPWLKVQIQKTKPQKFWVFFWLER